MGHMGISKCQLRARDTVFWPGISKDITEMVRGCMVCQKYQDSQTREPMIPHEVPSTPWTKLGSDLFQLGDHQYLIVTDYTSLPIQATPLSEDVLSNRRTRQLKVLERYNQHARPLTSLDAGQPVRTQTADGSWTLATVLAKHSNPRSYVIETNQGRQIRRNRRHIRADCQPPQPGYPPPRPDPPSSAPCRKQVRFAEEPVTTSPVPAETPPQPVHSCDVSRYGRQLRRPQKLDL